MPASHSFGAQKVPQEGVHQLLAGQHLHLGLHQASGWGLVVLGIGSPRKTNGENVWGGMGMGGGPGGLPNLMLYSQQLERVRFRAFEGKPSGFAEQKHPVEHMSWSSCSGPSKMVGFPCGFLLKPPKRIPSKKEPPTIISHHLESMDRTITLVGTSVFTGESSETRVSWVVRNGFSSTDDTGESNHSRVS